MTEKTDFTSNSSRSLVAMPKTKQELIARRLNSHANSFNDIVESLFIQYGEDADLMHFLEALDNDDAVTGKLIFDQFKAAERLQELAEPALDRYPATRILRALRVVLKRYGLTPEQRIKTMEEDAARRSASK